MSPHDAVSLTRELGGLPVPAHPVEMENPFDLLPDLIDAGLGGIEVYYPDHDDELRSRLIAITEEHNLIATGGSDFHGEGSRHTCEIGGIDIPQAAIDGLLSWPGLDATADGTHR